MKLLNLTGKRFIEIPTLILVAISPIIFATLPPESARAALIYWQNFENGDGVPDDASNSDGQLGVSNTAPTATSFSATGGIVGGSYDASSNTTPGALAGAGGLASTGASGGTPTNFGTLNQLTITMWIKADALPATSLNQAARLIVLGNSTVGDVQVANSLSIVVRSNISGKVNTVQVLSHTLDPTVGGIGSSPADSVVAGQWTFLALTYDGTSSLGNDSTAQQTATGGLSTVNGQYYRGSDTASVARTEVPLTTTAGSAGAASQGPFNFGSNGVLFLAGRPSGSRQFDGWIDDVRVYDQVLSASAIEAVRLEATVVPEPVASYLFLMVGIATLPLRTGGTKKE